MIPITIINTHMNTTMTAAKTNTKPNMAARMTDKSKRKRLRKPRNPNKRIPSRSSDGHQPVGRAFADRLVPIIQLGVKRWQMLRKSHCLWKE
ncbi:hypothetical protein LSG31_08980 [Fodinisporobacter ferrooxydans]|uniref:Uncharacterized protein n=1 Tax=Fodinisporobacter ferrooxydans TaxID=2901836 RepID=A0ABY4CPM8_9BACL|nr:hypothetical protein LSG31_08980 [Alicyclobacillaceae bacterium MYW30-H2]